jgi:hypothetical protein
MNHDRWLVSEPGLSHHLELSVAAERLLKGVGALRRQCRGEQQRHAGLVPPAPGLLDQRIPESGDELEMGAKGIAPLAHHVSLIDRKQSYTAGVCSREEGTPQAAERRLRRGEDDGYGSIPETLEEGLTLHLGKARVVSEYSRREGLGLLANVQKLAEAALLVSGQRDRGNDHDGHLLPRYSCEGRRLKRQRFFRPGGKAN